MYERVGFRPHLARVAEFARDRLAGQVLVAEAGGELVGVAAGAAFATTGWVGAVAVDPAHRRVGLGGALTAAIVERLEDRGAATVLLHATTLGRSVYERLGFVADSDCLTFAGPAAPGPTSGANPPAAAPGTRPGRVEDLKAVLALDQAATGEDRRRLLAALWPAGCLLAVDAGGEVAGFHLGSPWRPGGAAIARDPGTGLALLAAVRAGNADAREVSVSVSVPAANTVAVQALRAAGFEERFRTTRMHRGPRVLWQPAAVFGAHTLFWG